MLIFGKFCVHTKSMVACSNNPSPWYTLSFLRSKFFRTLADTAEKNIIFLLPTSFKSNLLKMFLD